LICPGYWYEKIPGEKESEFRFFYITEEGDFEIDES